jgi:MoaA/NifB/PqqE/SkfB family radical SAM enzyme
VRADVDQVKKTIREARDMGLLRNGGVNLTGGEALLLGEDLFDLIRCAKSLSVPVRLNTNTSWGADGGNFTSPDEMVEHLKECGVSMFAFSFDERVESSGKAFEGLAGAVGACETAGVLYQIVFTGVDDRQTFLLMEWLAKDLGRTPRFLHPVSMEMVDIGGAAGSQRSGAADAGPPGELALRSDCMGRGFYRPDIIHVDPGGGVRTCLYAPGLSNLGNLNNRSLSEILENFPNDPVSKAFREGQLEEVAERIFIPEAWKKFSHPCTASVALARLIEGAEGGVSEGRSDNCIDLDALNQRIAEDMGLSNSRI